MVKNYFKPFCWYTCALLSTYNHILIILQYLESASIWALFGPETDVESGSSGLRMKKNLLIETKKTSATQGIAAKHEGF